jgi:membrane-bound ClpP family serine protease
MSKENNNTGFAFSRQNYILMLAGIALILTGFILMAGGGTKDPAVFSEEIFDFRRVTLAPILVLSGFILEIVAILKKSKD